MMMARMFPTSNGKTKYMNLIDWSAGGAVANMRAAAPAGGCSSPRKFIAAIAVAGARAARTHGDKNSSGMYLLRSQHGAERKISNKEVSQVLRVNVAIFVSKNIQFGRVQQRA